MSQGRLKQVPVNIHIALLFSLKDREQERVGEKIKHLLKSLILPTLEELYCVLGFSKRGLLMFPWLLQIEGQSLLVVKLP